MILSEMYGKGAGVMAGTFKDRKMDLRRLL